MTIEERLQSIEQALEQLLARKRPRFSECRFLSIDATARNLGVHPNEVKRLIREGHLRAVPHGSRDVVPISELPKFDLTGIPPESIVGGRTLKRPKPQKAERSAAEEARAIRGIKIRRGDG